MQFKSFNKFIVFVISPSNIIKIQILSIIFPFLHSFLPIFLNQPFISFKLCLISSGIFLFYRISVYNQLVSIVLFRLIYRVLILSLFLLCFGILFYVSLFKNLVIFDFFIILFVIL